VKTTTVFEPLPLSLEPAAFPPAAFDPFVGAQSPPPQPPAPIVAISATPPAEPVVPPLDYRYLGRMIDPTGQQIVYLARGDKALPVAVGARLDEGYVVETITDDAIRLMYPAGQVHAVIPIPPAPEPSHP